MGKPKSRKAAAQKAGKSQQLTAIAPPKTTAFTFGEPVPVLDKRDILDYVECISNGKWYEPPVSFSGLAKSLLSAVHHSSPIYVKRNVLASTYIPHPLLSRQDFSHFALDYLVFGNAFLEQRHSVTGQLIRLLASPAKYTRRGVDDSIFWFVENFTLPHEFAPDTVFHLLEPDINQEIYGLPEYLSALNSAWLNESATLFRRKYYQNGAHAGYIMYVTDPAQSATDVESLREAMRNSKGLGNFKNLFFYAPGGKPDGIKIVPLSEVATKDDFFNIKKASAADMMDAHRVPFQLMGGKPENIGSLGDVEKVAKVFVRNELSPLQDRFREVNDWLGMEVIRFPRQPGIIPLKPPARRLFHTPPLSRLRCVTRAPPHPTAATTAPSRRAQTVIFIIAHHRWRAMLSPPRLPALWVGFNAVALPLRIRASSGGAGPELARLTHAKPCTCCMHS